MLSDDIELRPRRTYLGDEGSALQRSYDRLINFSYRLMIRKCPFVYFMLFGPSGKVYRSFWYLINLLIGFGIGFACALLLLKHLIPHTPGSFQLLVFLFSMLIAILFSSGSSVRAIFCIYPLQFYGMIEHFDYENQFRLRITGSFHTQANT